MPVLEKGNIINYYSKVLCKLPLSAPFIFFWYSKIPFGHLTRSTFWPFILWTSWNTNFMEVLTVCKTSGSFHLHINIPSCLSTNQINYSLYTLLSCFSTSLPKPIRIVLHVPKALMLHSEVIIGNSSVDAYLFLRNMYLHPFGSFKFWVFTLSLIIPFGVVVINLALVCKSMFARLFPWYTSKFQTK